VGDTPLGDLVMAGAAEQGAVSLGDRIFMSRGISNAYLVGTDDRAVLVNTGSRFEPHKARFDAVSTAPLAAIVFTQSHADHIGGWGHFAAPGVETIAHADYFDVRAYWTRVGPLYTNRAAKLWGSMMAAQPRAATPPPASVDPVPTITFQDTYELEVGGRRFELLSVPGGETTDSLLVWLPDERIVFSGNLMGPMYGNVPFLTTLRGDKLRSTMRFIRSVERLRDLEPEVLITGHGDPVRGADRIAADLTKLIDGVRWVHDQAVDGMNAGTDVFTLMRDIQPPPELTLGEGHGKVRWNVRAVWEEYIGWFRYESTTELYPVPPRAVWDDLAELAGGPDALAVRAAHHLAAGRPVEALHLVDIALAVEPTHQGSLEVSLGAHELLLERSGRTNLSETFWLEAEIATARAALADE
jgi:alkyl sulfatase BDS1-like metallo-beta-lactamase superfamily hydrolase